MCTYLISSYSNGNIVFFSIIPNSRLLSIFYRVQDKNHTGYELSHPCPRNFLKIFFFCISFHLVSAFPIISFYWYKCAQKSAMMLETKKRLFTVPVLISVLNCRNFHVEKWFGFDLHSYRFLKSIGIRNKNIIKLRSGSIKCQCFIKPLCYRLYREECSISLTFFIIKMWKVGRQKVISSTSIIRHLYFVNFISIFHKKHIYFNHGLKNFDKGNTVL